MIIYLGASRLPTLRLTTVTHSSWCQAFHCLNAGGQLQREQMGAIHLFREEAQFLLGIKNCELKITIQSERKR